MKLVIILACLFGLLACGRESPPLVDAGLSLNPGSAEAASAKRRNVELVTATPKEIGALIASKGKHLFGPLTVEVLEEDGKAYCSTTRLIRADEEEDPVSGTRVERETVGLKFDFGDNLDGDWFVYVHTTHEVWAFGKKGWLCGGTFEIKPDGSMRSNVGTDFIGKGWEPSAEEIERIPEAVITRVKWDLKYGR